MFLSDFGFWILNFPPGIELLKQADFTRLIIEAKKIIGGMLTD